MPSRPDTERLSFGLGAEERTVLEDYPPPNVFAVVSWGCAATSWLAKALNSHPDIYCVHAANTFWQKFGHAPFLDGPEYLRLIGSQGYAHKAAGDVHGISRETVPRLREVFGESFGCAVVVREPMTRLRSQCALFERYARFRSWGDLDGVIGPAQAVGVNVEGLDYAGRLFIHGVSCLNAIIDESRIDRVFRCEDLTSDAGSLVDFVHHLTGMEPTRDWAEMAVTAGPVNPHRGHRSELVEFDDRQRDIIRRCLHPKTWDLYEQLGYARPEWLT